MTATGVVELKGARVTVPIEDWRAVGWLAPILLGLTPSDVPEKRAAAWALRRAGDLVLALRREARAL